MRARSRSVFFVLSSTKLRSQLSGPGEIGVYSKNMTNSRKHLHLDPQLFHESLNHGLRITIFLFSSKTISLWLCSPKRQTDRFGVSGPKSDWKFAPAARVRDGPQRFFRWRIQLPRVRVDIFLTRSSHPTNRARLLGTLDRARGTHCAAEARSHRAGETGRFCCRGRKGVIVQMLGGFLMWPQMV